MRNSLWCQQITSICTKSYTTTVFINLFTVTYFGSNFETSSAFYKADTEKLHTAFTLEIHQQITSICTKSHTKPVFINLFTVTHFGSNFETSSALFKADTEKLHTAFSLEIHHKCIKPFTYTSNVKEGQPWDTCVYVNIC
jgi:hypothetical protein